jgi:polysaccharide export outer membrane protein
MKIFLNRQIGFLVFIACILNACNADKKIVYAQDAGHYPNLSDTSSVAIPANRVKIGDLLIITVSTTTPEISMPFNLPLVPTPSSDNTSGYSATSAVTLQTYLVNTDGNITFPVIGQIKAAGMTETELAQTIRNLIYPRYVKEDPIITIRYANYKISVLGEVSRPGVFPIVNENVNLFEAIAMAGDLTIYGRRNNVLLIREESDGKRETYRLNLGDKNLIHSPYFYMQQNDVLYVQPNGPKARSSAFDTAETLSVSIIGTLISLASFLALILKR